MKYAVAGYKAEEVTGGILLSRSYAGITDQYRATNFEDAVEFLVSQFPYTIHVCWNLYSFTEALFSLLSSKDKKQLEKNSKVVVGNIKIFSVDRMLGLTRTTLIRGNIAERVENNFYNIYRWLPETKRPETAREVEELGTSIVDGLGRMQIFPDKLTSPIGVLIDQLDTEALPTIWSFNENWLDAMLYAEQIASYEWRAKYKTRKQGYWYDITSAYPYFMLDLPDTDKCVATYSKKWLPCDWGVIKGKVNMTAKIHPLNTKAEYFTTEEIQWLVHYSAGTWEMEDGWFLKFTSNDKPYAPIVNKLLQTKANGDPMVKSLAKLMGAGLSGKLDQYNKDGKLGELYNSILAVMVRSRCRLAVADFIYDNKLVDDIIAVQVDGIETTKELDLPDNAIAGQWRHIR